MAKTKPVKPVKKHVFKDPNIEDIIEVEIEFMCPKRGKVKQKVKVKKMKKVASGVVKKFMGISSVIDDIEQEDNERLLSAETDTEE